jgi:hypothetical protein
MTNLGRRLRKLEAQRPTGEDLVIQIEYVNEPPKCFTGEREERPRPLGYGTGVTTVYLRKDDPNL